MKKQKQIIGTILLCIFEAAIGVLLLWNPMAFTEGIIVVGGVLLAAVGLLCIFRYFRMEVEEAAETQELLKGLLLVALGMFCALKSQWFLETFPVLTVLYGVLILVAGLYKVQWTVDLLRRKRQRWLAAAIDAAVALVCAVVVLCDPFTAPAGLWMFTGIALLVEAVFDLVALVLTRRPKEAAENYKQAQQ